MFNYNMNSLIDLINKEIDISIENQPESFLFTFKKDDLILKREAQKEIIFISTGTPGLMLEHIFKDAMDQFFKYERSK